MSIPGVDKVSGSAGQHTKHEITTIANIKTSNDND